jgi:hypothetical protein
VPGEDVGAVDNTGAVNVLYGSATGLQATSPDDQFWHQDSPEVRGMAESDDLFGSSLGAGDFNADGFADLAIGVVGEEKSRRGARAGSAAKQRRTACSTNRGLPDALLHKDMEIYFLTKGGFDQQLP